MATAPVARRGRGPARFDPELTRVEEEVVFSIAEGMDFRVYAELHGVTYASVRYAASRAYHKLGVSNRIQAMQMVADAGRLLVPRHGYWGA
jgi:DNA-binding CsgD family transcriptional regulator